MKKTFMLILILLTTLTLSAKYSFNSNNLQKEQHNIMKVYLFLPGMEKDYPKNKLSNKED